MFIFYDFETSSRELLGQILNYAFVVTDAQLNPVSELSGYIRLNRTQLPEIDAILVNKINVDWLQANGESEYEAATRIFEFLRDVVAKNGPCTLAGFNSNQFDLGFLRNLLIGYGFNPYFEGKLGNKDILHFAQFLAFQNTDQFPWIRVKNDTKSYYSFKLEDLCSAFGLLQEAQSHNATDDVYLTILLAKTLQDAFGLSFSEFNPIQVHLPPDSQLRYRIGLVKRRDFAEEDRPLKHYKQIPMLCLAKDKKMALFVNLELYESLTKKGIPLSNAQKLSCIQYVNENKHFFVLNPIPIELKHNYDDIADDVFKDPIFLAFSKHAPSYFEAIKKNWDIAYQIHELGFDRIPMLRELVIELFEKPESYSERLKSLLTKRTSPKDNYLIQLYNRVYLNCSETPDQGLLKRYLEARYVSGVILKNPEGLVSISDQIKRLETLLDGDISDGDFAILSPLLTYFGVFTSQF